MESYEFTLGLAGKAIVLQNDLFGSYACQDLPSLRDVIPNALFAAIGASPHHPTGGESINVLVAAPHLLDVVDYMASGFVDIAQHADGHTRVTLSVNSGREATTRENVIALTSPLVDELGGRSVTASKQGRGLWDVGFTIAGDVCTIGQLVEIRERLEPRLIFADRYIFTAHTALEFFLAGKIEALEGLPESQWLDAKQYQYESISQTNAQGNLTHMFSADAKLELCLDVVAFANAQGGILLIGFKDAKDGYGKDVLGRVSPVPLGVWAREKSYLDTLQSHIYPSIVGLSYHSYPYGRGEVIAVYVPPQAAHLKPFLVRGGDSNRRAVRASSLAIAHRGHDGNIPVGIEEVHAQLVAGRAFLGMHDAQEASPTDLGEAGP